MSKLTNSKSWMKRALGIALLFALSSAYMFAQQVKGIVKDSAGDPLIGVNIVEKGTTNGTVTNVNGEFTINAAKGKTLVFSYMGYKPQEAVVKNGKLNVYLKEDTQLLNETVVVGYGSMQRKDVTSSITTVKAEDLNKGVFTDPAQMLQGKVPGLVVTSTGDPNGTPSITLRGASSLREGAAMSPYYVIDGIPGVDIAMVAPDDIESIDVLRDATATAIYGSKAANGVIIITTKKGKEGRTNVTYNGYASFETISKTLDMATADDLKWYAAQNNITLNNDQGANTNWQDEVLRTGITHSHNLSINGGTKTTTYMVSANFQNRQGVIKTNGNNRINFRSLLTTKLLKDHLDVSVGANAMIGKHVGVKMDNEGASVLDAMNYFSPLIPVTNEDGTWGKSTHGSRNYNPVSLLNEDRSNNQWKRLQVIAKATLHIVKGLDWNFNYSYNSNQRTFSGYNSHNTQLEGVSGKNGLADRSTWLGDDHTFETYGNFDRTFCEDHKVSAMIGYSWEQRNSGDGFGLKVHNFYNDYLTSNNLGYAGEIDGMSAVISGAKETVRNISFYGRIGYSYASRYMLQATLRRDGSSVFGKDNRWGTFPSVSAAWNITEEAFMKNQEVLTNLKLRLGYGISGNALGFGAYTPYATYGASGTFVTVGDEKYPSFNATKLPNPNLKWETTGMFNIGIDYAFLGGRINGSIEYYNKKTKDLIWTYPVSPLMNPFTSISANVGEITNNGIEFSINADVIQTKDFRWTTGLNLSHNANRVDKLSNEKYSVDTFDQGEPMVSGVSANGWTQRIIEGESLGTFYTYQFAGYNEAGKSTYYTRDAETGELDGGVTEEPGYKDRTITGCAQPKLTMGWNNTLSWKNWSATMFFTGVFGNKIYNGTRANYTSGDMFNGGKNVLKEYIYDRPATDNTSNVPSDKYLENGTYFRFQTLTIGYTFNNFNGWIKSLQLYGTCNNVFTLSSYKGLDPEVNLGGLAPGVDYRWNVYPHTRSFIVGAKINF